MLQMIGGWVSLPYVDLENGSTDHSSEEILIGFEELIGEHSGKNMAEVLWHTMDIYGLIGRVCASILRTIDNI